MVAAVAFSALLACDLAVYVASQDRAVLYSEGDASGTAYQQFRVLEAAEGADVLEGTQSVLGSAPLWCPGASSQVARGIAGLSGAQDSGGVVLAVSPTLGGSAFERDNLSALSPFEGAIPGELNIVLRFAATGSEGPGVTFSKAEVHYVHLDLRLQAAVSRCEAAATAVVQALARPASNCSSAAIGAEVAAAVRAQARAAAGEGFTLALTYSVSASPACSVGFEVRLAQAAVQGLSSTFGVAFYYGWRVTVAAPAPPARE
jgi:hypothetical protein